MKFYFKRTTDADISFYSECFQNEGFQYMLYGNSPLNLQQLGKYIESNSKDYKFVFSLEKQGKKDAVGFVHFYHNKDYQYSYVGGIHPNYINSGLGVLASVAALSLFFDINEKASFDTGIYKHNLQSLRLHLSIGFVITEETEDMYVLLLKKENFNNNFVQYVKKRIDYRYITEG